MRWVWKNVILLHMDDRAPESVDSETASLLEGLAPISSSDDLNILRGLIHSRKIFPKIRDRTKRVELLANIEGIKYMIPTLYSLFEGIKQLEPACNILKRLISPTRKSIRESLIDLYSPPATAPIDGYKLACTWESVEAQRDFLYIQLWVFCLRNFYYLTSFTPQKEKGKPKPEPQRSNPALKQQLGDLAVRSSFATKTAQEWQSRIPHRALAESFRTDIEVGIGTALGISMSAIASTIVSFPTLEIDTRPAKMFSSQTYDRDRRNGRPFSDDYQADRLTYFLFPLIRAAIYIDESCISISSSFVRLDLLQSFLGYYKMDTLRPVPEIDILSKGSTVINRNEVDTGIRNEEASLPDHSEYMVEGTAVHASTVEEWSRKLQDSLS